MRHFSYLAISKATWLHFQSTSEDHDSSANRSKASIGDGNDDEESGTLVRHLGGDDDDESGGTMIQHATLVPDAVAGGAPAGGAVPGGGTGASNVESYLGTMVINEDEDEEDEATMKRECSRLLHVSIWRQTVLLHTRKENTLRLA